jgi:type IV secretory pathway VirB10-like protein
MLETGKCRKEKKEGGKKRILNLPQGGLYTFHRVCSLQNLLCKFGHMAIRGVVPAHGTETHHTSYILSTGTDKPLLPPPSMYDHDQDHPKTAPPAPTLKKKKKTPKSTNSQTKKKAEPREGGATKKTKQRRAPKGKLADMLKSKSKSSSRDENSIHYEVV